MRKTARLGTLSVLSIGIGGMVGGGIFAVTGLTIQLTQGAAPLAFVLAGIVALLTSYSYLKLTLRFPDNGGTVSFLNRAFGTGIFTGSANILLCFSYVVLLAIYAFAFGSYGAGFLTEVQLGLPAWLPAIRETQLLASVIIILLLMLNIVCAAQVIRSENFFNLVKMGLLAIFVVVGLSTPLQWERMAVSHYPDAVLIFSGAMIIFLNYEGFELIANAAKDVRNPAKSLPVAYIGGVLIAIVLYVLIVTVVLGHLDFQSVAAESNHALAAAARAFMGETGFFIIVVAALFATSSAINATLYSSGRMTYVIARSGELPESFEEMRYGLALEGMILFAVIALLLVNLVPLYAIATMGSAGFLLIFAAVNMANVRLAHQTDSKKWLSQLGALACVAALVALVWQTEADPRTRQQIWVLVGMIVSACLTEIIYRGITGRRVNLLDR